jgi:hypothetical protein
MNGLAGAHICDTVDPYRLWILDTCIARLGCKDDGMRCSSHSFMHASPRTLLHNFNDNLQRIFAIYSGT